MRERGKRGPRGKYARLICQKCRSRKIKCVLLDSDDIRPLGSPRAPEKTCDRCRSVSLECIFEPTVLGHDTRITTGNSTARAEGPSSSSVLDVGEYLFAQSANESLTSEENTGPLPFHHTPRRRLKTTFKSMIEPSFLLSAILAKDQTFGSSIPRATSPWNKNLIDLVSDDMAITFDSWLRNRLALDESASTNIATNLLCPTLPDCSGDSEVPSLKHPILMQSMQLALSTFGQAFIFVPYRSRLVRGYKATALTTFQSISHEALKSQLYINLAYQIADRLELLPAHTISAVNKPNSLNSSGWENILLDSLQGLQIYYYDAFPIHVMRKVLANTQPHIELYQLIINHIQSVIAIKQNWASLEAISGIIEKAENDNNCLIHSSICGNGEELLAMFSSVCRVEILYTLALRARITDSTAKEGPDITNREIVHASDRVIDTFHGFTWSEGSFITFLERFGKSYPKQLEFVFEKFIQCVGNLTLNGVTFHHPPRHLIHEIVRACKNLVENSIINYKLDGTIPEGFNRRVELLAKCEERLSRPIDVAFSGGCIHAAGSKPINLFLDFMESLRARAAAKQESTQDQSNSFELCAITQAADCLIHLLPSIEWALWPEIGEYNLWRDFENNTDYSSILSIFPGSKLTSSSIQ
ncbi:hypothetical protein BGW36DRAFT_442583 [Talaromyces proteolyticus]|uniref:Zn(2)-C6 fungal-type domain-containing protein n=1 Tax=Talaromyces proteolyticus TaxID=1131652 RepID=A0AAD4PTY6_9EURO|nr:uncharacterized protein BGW36DRAFT_442583 [Talaromyces proteolyticus]KAH8688714.1 hypothetical protein BGW36DRAFT_442583 [Talaromyces proteolyticus]